MTLESDLGELVQAKPALIKKSQHPSLPLTIYNYTNHAQWKKVWNPCTMMARGLVVEQGTSRIVARPMTKFFNYSEGLHKTQDTGRFTVLEKVDGSMGVWFYYKGQWMMATRGSFISAQATQGKKMAVEARLEENCDPNKTYCFEIVYPEDRHLVNYNYRRELVLLAVLDTETGSDTPNKDLSSIATRLRVRAADSHAPDILQLSAIHKLNRPNEEGFVIRFDTTGERVKIKFDTYMHLAKHGLGGSALQGKPPMSVHDMIIERLFADPDDRMENYLDNIPDELYGEAQQAQDQFLIVFTEGEATFERYIKQYHDTPFKDIDKGVPGQNLVFKWLKIERNGSAKEGERVKVKREFAITLTRRELLNGRK